MHVDVKVLICVNHGPLNESNQGRSQEIVLGGGPNCNIDRKIIIHKFINKK